MMKMKKLLPLAAALILCACDKQGGEQAAAAPATADAVATAVAVADALVTVEAATPQKEPVDPAVLRMMELLRAVYEGDVAGETYVEAEMQDPKDRSIKDVFHLEPVAMHELADGSVALVANAQEIDKSGRVITGHVRRGLLSFYVMRKEAGKWLVEKRHENIASLGSNGTFSEVKWVTLGEGKPGFVVEHGGSWMGSTIAWLSVLDLTDGSLHDLTGHSVSLYSDNEVECTDDRSRCWRVSGKWEFEKREGSGHDDLVLRFTGFNEVRPAKAPDTAARQRETVTGMARYQFDGQRYVLVEGKNIVPEI